MRADYRWKMSLLTCNPQDEQDRLKARILIGHLHEASDKCGRVVLPAPAEEVVARTNAMFPEGVK